MDKKPDSKAVESGALPLWQRSPALKLAILPILAAIGFVIVYGAGGVGRDTKPKIHSLRNPAACAECHPGEDMTSLKGPEADLCYRCHDNVTHGISHPVGVKAKVNTDPALWMLDGKVACSTCHDPHGKTGHEALLRRTGNALCEPCHPEHVGKHGGH
ncbi:MAG: cytochrome c3 family protein [Planctomycetota bacterium]